MAPATNGRYLFKKPLPASEGYPTQGVTFDYDPSQTIDLDAVDLNGGVLVKLLVLSIDPYLRGRMRPAGTNYSNSFVPGEPLVNFAVALVLRSESDAFAATTHIYGLLPFQEYIVIPASSLSAYRLLHNPEKLPWSNYVGVAGMPGKTAFMAWKEYAKAKKGDVVFVSTGAGAVGSVVIQLAKLDGLKVIASAGSDEKVAYMREIGADVAFNYKTTDVATVLAKEGPIDVYWDNVGGSTLDAALGAAKKHARFIECGMISRYNKDESPVQNLFQIIGKSLSVNGFIVSDLHHKYEEEFYATVPKLVSTKQLKFVEDITEGLENAGTVILAQQKGLNTGKSVILVAKE